MTTDVLNTLCSMHCSLSVCVYIYNLTPVQPIEVISETSSDMDPLTSSAPKTFIIQTVKGLTFLKKIVNCILR
jgi:hypothetical protein